MAGYAEMEAEAIEEVHNRYLAEAIEAIVGRGISVPLVGHSFGCHLVINLAISRPDLILNPNPNPNILRMSLSYQSRYLEAGSYP